MGKNGTNDAQILRFGATQACPYTTCGTTVELAKVDTVNNQCRHQFTARVTRSCALAEVYLKFGNETGGSEDSYPHVIEIKKTTSGYRVTLDEEVSNMSSDVRANMERISLGARGAINTNEGRLNCSTVLCESTFNVCVLGVAYMVYGIVSTARYSFVIEGAFFLTSSPHAMNIRDTQKQNMQN